MVVIIMTKCDIKEPAPSIMATSSDGHVTLCVSGEQTPELEVDLPSIQSALSEWLVFTM